MTFTDRTKTVEITLTDANGIDWTADFFQVGDLEMTEDGAYIVEDTALLIEAIEDYKAGRGDYEGMECNSDIEVEEVEAPAYITFTCTDGEEVTIDIEDIEDLHIYPDGCGIELKDGTLYYPEASLSEVKEMIEEAKA